MIQCPQWYYRLNPGWAAWRTNADKQEAMEILEFLILRSVTASVEVEPS